MFLWPLKVPFNITRYIWFLYSMNTTKYLCYHKFSICFNAFSSSFALCQLKYCVIKTISLPIRYCVFYKQNWHDVPRRSCSERIHDVYKLPHYTFKDWHGTATTTVWYWGSLCRCYMLHLGTKRMKKFILNYSISILNLETWLFQTSETTYNILTTDTTHIAHHKLGSLMSQSII